MKERERAGGSRGGTARWRRASVVALVWLVGSSITASRSPVRRMGPISYSRGSSAAKSPFTWFWTEPTMALADSGSGGAGASPGAPAAGAPNPAHTVMPPSGSHAPSIPTEPAADGTYPLSLAQLSSFDYQVPSDDDVKNADDDASKLPDQIPAPVHALDGKSVSLDGFILPLDIGTDEIRRFVLSPSLAGCCWGGPTKMNDWVDVHVSKKDLGERLSRMDPTVPITVWGKLAVGAVIENGWVASLYRMELERVAPREAKAAGS